MLNRHNLNIVKLAAKQESQHQLTGLRVEPGRTSVTDGVRLMTVTTPGFPIADYPDLSGTLGVKPTKQFEPFTMDAETALKIAKAIPKRSSIPILGVAVVGEASNANGSAQIAVTDLENPQVFSTAKLDGQYPDIDRVIPAKGTKPLVKIGLDARMLAGMLQQVVSFHDDVRKGQEVYCELSIYGPEVAMRLDCHNNWQEMVGVLMPCRPPKTGE